jgi:hypothetical protein
MEIIELQKIPVIFENIKDERAGGQTDRQTVHTAPLCLVVDHGPGIDQIQVPSKKKRTLTVLTGYTSMLKKPVSQSVKLSRQEAHHQRR